jgi:hypothetical protein
MIWEAVQANKLNKLKALEFGEILKGVQASANALYTSLNEERLFTDEEIKQRQLESEKQFRALLKGSSASPSASKPLSKP